MTTEQDALVATALWLLQDTSNKIMLGKWTGPPPSEEAIRKHRSVSGALLSSAYSRCLHRVKDALDEQQWVHFHKLLALDLQSSVRDIFVVRAS